MYAKTVDSVETARRPRGTMSRIVSVLAAVAVSLASVTAAEAIDKKKSLKRGSQIGKEIGSRRGSILQDGAASRRAGSKTKIKAEDIKGPKAIITVDEPVHDFAEQWIGPPLKHTFTIKNTGDKTLEITRVKPSCGCTIAGSYPRKIEPGKSGEFPFSISSQKLRGRFEKSITISTNDPVNSDFRLRLRGEMKRYVDVAPQNANFGKITGNERKERVLTVTNNTDKPIELTLDAPKDGPFEIELIEKDKGQKYELRIAISPPFKPGSLRSSITLNTNVEAQKVVKIQVRGTVPERLDVQPTSITIAPPRGSRPSGRGISRIIRFTNYGEKPVKLLEATVDDTKVKVTINERTAGKAYTIVVEMPAGYTPPPTGRTITLKTDDKEKPTITVALRAPSKRTTRASRRPAQDMVGQMAPSFSGIELADGGTFASADFKDKVTVIDFFAVNCGFCKKQIPRLEKVRQEYQSKGVRFVAMAETMRKKYSKEEVLTKIKELGFRGELALDLDNHVGPLFKATSYPTMVLVGKTGKIEAVNIGNVGDLESRMKKQLDAMLAGKPVPTVATAKPASKPRQRPAEAMVGKPAPAFSTKTIADKSLSTSELKGTVTVLDFFAVNCGFCKKQIPRLETVRKKYEGKPVRFIAMAETMRKKYSAEETIAKITDLGFKGELVLDPDNAIGPLFKATSYPTMVVIGKTGKIEAVTIGNVGDLESRLSGQIDALLAGKPLPKTPSTAKATPPKRARPGDLIGKPAPKFATKTIDGKDLSNAQLTSHPATVLNFFATNCGYCKKQIPRLETLRKKYEEKGVRFVNVSQKMRKAFEQKDVVAKMKDLGFQGELVIDHENKIGRLFNATGFPTMVVLGKSGKVEAVNVGNIGDLEKRVSAQLDAAIAGKPMPKAAAAPRSSRRPAQDLVGKKAPDFSLTTLDGKIVESAGFSKHPATVLNFVAPNCGFCKRQLPNVEKVRAEYESKGVRFVNIAQTMRKEYTIEETVKVFKGAGSNLELAKDDKNVVGKKFKAVSFPTMIVVDRSGKITNVNIGAKKNLESLLKGQLDALLKGS